MQKHVVIARFDDKTDGTFKKWKRIAYEAQSRVFDDAALWPPHISIAAYEGCAPQPRVFEIAEGIPVICEYIAINHVFFHDLWRFMSKSKGTVSALHLELV